MQRYNTQIPLGPRQAFLGSQHNEVFDTVDQLRARYSLIQQPASAPGTTGTAAAGQSVMVYGDLPGHFYSNGSATIATVPCLPMTLVNGVMTVDTSAAYIDAYPAGSAAVSLDQGGCCGGDESIAIYDGLTFDEPYEGDNRIRAGDASEDALVVRGTCNPRSTINISVEELDGSPARTETGIVPNQTTGEWASAAINLTASTAFAKGLIRIEATEVLSNGVTTLPVRYCVLSYETASNSQVTSMTNRPTAPVLLTDAGGEPDEDNRTTDTTPTFRLTLPASAPAPDVTGETWVLLFDGVVEASGAIDAFDTVREIEVTVGTKAEGDHQVQWCTAKDDPTGGNFEYHGGTSPITYITISANADDPEPADTRRWSRDGWMVTDASGAKRVFVGPCRHEMGETEINKLDGSVTATVQANGAFATSTDPIPVDNYTVTDNPTGSADPAAVTSLAQPTVPVEGVDNALITLRITGTEVVIVSVGPAVT